MNTDKMIARKNRWINNLEETTAELNAVIAEFSNDTSLLAKALNHHGFISYSTMIKMAEKAGA